MNGDIHGIVIVHPDIPDLNSIKIDVLCGSTKYSGTGTILLNMVSYITEIIGKPTIILTSVESAKNFYKHSGFEYNDNINTKREYYKMKKLFEIHQIIVEQNEIQIKSNTIVEWIKTKTC